MHRRTLLRAAGAALAIPAGASFAQSFPARPITIVVPYAAGGNADLTARLFADALTRTIGGAVVVDSKGGGGGAIGAMHVINSRPDGHTLLLSAPSVFSVTPHLVKVNYGLSNIRPVFIVSKTPVILVARKGSKFKSLADLIQASKAGNGAVQMGYSGLGTPNHLAMLNLETIANARFTGVPYKGSGPMLQDLLAGQIEVAPDQYSSSKPYIESGDLVPIGVFGEKMPELPAVPLVSTLGAEPFDVTTYLGISAPAGTPDAVIATLQKAAAPAIQDPKFIAGMIKMGTAAHYGTAQEYDSLMRNEDEFMRKMVAQGRVKKE